MTERGNIYDIQIVGAGPAGIGPFVAADRAWGLERFLKGRSVVLINPDRRLGSGGLRGLKINSNSPGDDFLEGISSERDLARVLTTDAARIVRRYGQNALPLPNVADFLEVLGNRVAYAVETSPKGSFIEGEVHNVHIFDDGNGGAIFESETYRNGQAYTVARSRSLVIATGAEERLQDPIKYWVDDPTLYKYKGKTVDSRVVLTEEAIDQIKGRNSLGGSVIILGSSHSAWSAAHKLLEQIDDPALRISIFSRSGIKPFFPSESAAEESGYQFETVSGFRTENDICAKTRRVNRFLGIRGDSLDLYLRVQAGTEKRVQIHPYQSTEDIEDHLESASTVVQATGYKVNKLYLYDYTGRFGTGVAGTSDSDHNRINEQAQILTDWDDVIPGAYGTGLGRSRLPIEKIGGEPNARGKSIDGVNVYHGPVGELIIQGINSDISPREI